MDLLATKDFIKCLLDTKTIVIYTYQRAYGVRDAQ